MSSRDGMIYEVVQRAIHDRQNKKGFSGPNARLILIERLQDSPSPVAHNLTQANIRKHHWIILGEWEVYGWRTGRGSRWQNAMSRIYEVLVDKMKHCEQCGILIPRRIREDMIRAIPIAESLKLLCRHCQTFNKL